MTTRGVPERGAVAIMLAVSMVFLLGLVAIVVDVGQIYSRRSQLQNAADAAAMASVRQDLVNFNSVQSVAVAYALNNAPGQGAVTTAADVAVGRWDRGTRTFTPGGQPFNAVQVAAHRTADHGNPVELTFANIFGISESDVSATAVAAIGLPAGAAEVIPMSLRDVEFGPVDPEIEEVNPGKDGPGPPALQAPAYQVGDEVTLCIFGKGEQSPVHLALDVPGADVSKVFRAEEAPVPVQIGEEYHVIGEGTGQGGLCRDVEERLEFPAVDARRDVVVPVVSIVPGQSRNVSGELSGKVLVSDLVSVHIERVDDDVPIQDPTDPDKIIEIRILIGTVTETTSGITGGGTSSGVGGGTVLGIASLVE